MSISKIKGVNLAAISKLGGILRNKAYKLSGQSLLDSYTVSLLHMNGTDGSTTFIDQTRKVWTANGGAQIDTAQSKFGGSSLALDGTVDYIETPDSVDFTMGSGDFTVDMWFYRNGGNGTIRYLFGQANSTATDSTRPYEIRLSTGNVLQANIYDTSQKQITGTTAITATGWHHAALVRTSSTVKLFLDGVKEGTDLTGVGTLVDSANKMAVGRLGENSGLSWNGWIDEFRISKGIARWTSNFTPQATEY